MPKPVTEAERRRTVRIAARAHARDQLMAAISEQHQMIIALMRACQDLDARLTRLERKVVLDEQSPVVVHPDVTGATPVVFDGGTSPSPAADVAD